MATNRMALAEQWFRQHKSGGGTLSYGEIAAREGRTFSQVREAVRDYRQISVRAEHSPHPQPIFNPPPEELPSLEELFRLARASADVINRIDPVVTYKEIEIPVASGEAAGIIFTSCAHLGSRYAFYEKFEEIFRRVLGVPRLYWVSLGDDIEGFLSGFPDASAVTDQAIAKPKAQRMMLAGTLEKLAQQKKLLCGCASQHGGAWTQKKTGENPIKDMYLDHKVPFFDGKALITLKVGRAEYRIALAHEFPGSSIYNANHAQRRASLFDFPSADVIVQGDKHKFAVTEMSLPPFEFDAGLRPSYMQFLVQVGTGKVGLDKYSIAGWSRGVLEWPILIFHEDRHCVEYTRELARAQMMLNGLR